MTRWMDFIISGEGAIYITCTLFIILLTYKYFGPTIVPLENPEEKKRDQQLQALRDTPATPVARAASSPRKTQERQLSPREILYVPTSICNVRVTRIGHASERGNIITLHDLVFCIYHIDFPGQTEDDEPLPQLKGLEMNDLAKMVDEICQYFQIQTFIGFGAGLGSNVLLRYASMHTSKVEALILLDATRKSAEMEESLTYSLLNRTITTFGMTDWAMECFANIHFSAWFVESKKNMIASYKRELKDIPVSNLLSLLHLYRNRKSLSKETLSRLGNLPILLVASGHSPYVIPLMPFPSAESNAFDLLGYLSRKTASMIKISSSGRAIATERPAELCEPVVLFLNGLGYL